MQAEIVVPANAEKERVVIAAEAEHELANQVGLDLPEFLGKLKTEAEKVPQTDQPDADDTTDQQ
ncbi:MAG: hypothetical protein ACLFVY_06700 [Phycisphaerae bacterium]